MLKSKISEQNGATLLEVLISFAILSILLLSSMNFFLQSYKYTTQNKDKTTAVYLAQNVMNYMQKQSFMKMEGYVTYQLTKNPNKPLVELSMSLCNSPVTVSPINPLNHNERVSDVDNVFLFDDTARCQAVLTPIINNKQYTNDDIKIYIMPSVEQSDLDDLLNTSPNLPSLLKENLEANQNVTNLSFRTSLLHVFILINSENRNKAVLLEGTIVDESIR
ncbi:type IV pilus modification PilV family protein [Bacillus salinus]|uniref:type IV pilus modification PilV family protein n=1 Tax=Bacillus sp. HMF5848 TaxID=2495421 RepID=UPI00163A9938|nr:prepilin-type N-terminal cleavage/methylation domain-containing protein [Bacillus sp. HMF5848]